jgi:hypothetical protein
MLLLTLKAHIYIKAEDKFYNFLQTHGLNIYIYIKNDILRILTKFNEKS